MADFEFSAPVDCVATPSTGLGGTCNLVTTADTLVPGFADGGRRTVISALSMSVQDAGPDQSLTPPEGACPPTCGSGDESTFLRQGLFTP